MARSLSVCFWKCSVSLFEWTFFPEVPRDRLIRFGVLMLPFLLSMWFLLVLVFEAVGVIHCKVNSFSTFSNVFFSHPIFLPPLISFCSRSSVILAGFNINADVTEFLKLQLAGINRNCKRIPLPHFAIFLTNYCPSKSCRRMGIWK